MIQGDKISGIKGSLAKAFHNVCDRPLYAGMDLKQVFGAIAEVGQARGDNVILLRAVPAPVVHASPYRAQRSLSK
jgi:hypothetical protein